MREKQRGLLFLFFLLFFFKGLFKGLRFRESVFVFCFLTLLQTIVKNNNMTSMLTFEVS